MFRQSISSIFGVPLIALYSKSKPLLPENGSVLQFQIPTKLTLKQGLLGCVRMDNVIELFGKKLQVEEELDPVLEFVHDQLIPWAIENGLDIDSMKFKLNGATVMTCLQGMLLDDI